MPTVVVLGGGRVGQAIARDLAAEMDVRVFDAFPAAVEAARKYPRITAEVADLSRKDVVTAVCKDADLVVGALPSWLGLDAMDAVLDAGKNMVDISFLAEDPAPLSAKAQQKGLTVVYDCGVAPGLSNFLCARALARFDKVESLAIYVGGLPKVRSWPWEYKAGFSPLDVIEEYTRPARYVSGGKEIVREALSDPEFIEFAGVGTLEAFNTDGLRSLLRLPVPDMIEKTMRYPGHIALMRVLRESGFFSKEPVKLKDGRMVAPLDLTAALMVPQWTFQPGEADVTVMKVIAKGLLAGKKTTLTTDLYDEYSPATGMTSMSRTTAYPCTQVVRMVLDGTIRQPGVNPPEAIAGVAGLWDRLVVGLEARGVKLRETVE